jgi:hypothetical protein
LPKAAANDLLGRVREVVSDPLNLLIEEIAKRRTGEILQSLDRALNATVRP